MVQKFIKGQEATVTEKGNKEIENQDKAREMAKTEDFYHEQAGRFQEYLKDPKAFSKTLEWRPKVADINVLYSAEYFKRLVQSGITPDDLRIIGDRVAEVRGSAVDYEETVREKSTVQLKIEAAVFTVLNFKHGMSGLAGAIKNPSISWAITELTINRDNQKLEVWLKKEVAERELIARDVEQAFGPEAAARVRIKDIPFLQVK